jgi:hypothetical protein
VNITSQKFDESLLLIFIERVAARACRLAESVTEPVVEFGETLKIGYAQRQGSRPRAASGHHEPDPSRARGMAPDESEAEVSLRRSTANDDHRRAAPS